MALELSASKTTGTGLAMKPAALLAGAKAFVLAHPLGVLSLVGGALVLVGLSDAVRGYRAKKQAVAAETPAQPESTW